LTDDELAQGEQQARDRINVNRDFDEVWSTRKTRILTRRTSLIIDPPDGKLPPRIKEAEQRRTAKVAAQSKRGPADSYEDRRLSERCIMNEQNGPPIIPVPVDGLLGVEFLFQIFQNSEHVAILSERLPQLRIIPLDGRPHLPPSIPQWLGDSRGRWDGATLIVETTNLHAGRSIAGFPAGNSRVIERFTRSGPDAIDYRFTVDDSTTWSRSWTATVPITKTHGKLYEYACHEGNYGLVNILSTARALERLAADTAK
jgi:hypothetical protein